MIVARQHLTQQRLSPHPQAHMPFLFRLLSHLPLAVLHNLGASMGWLVYLASATYRRHLRANTAQAGDWAVSARGAAIAAAGQGLFELPYLWLRPRAEVLDQVVKVTGWEQVEAAWAAEKAILFLTPHLGCFEITAQYYAARRAITVLYRPPKQRWLQGFIEHGRAGGQLHLASADAAGVRTLLKALRRKEAIGILPDQAPGQGEGIWAPFFGRPAYTMTLAARLMAAHPAPAVLMTHAERLPYGAGYHLQFSTFEEFLGQETAEALDDRVAQMNTAIEAQIRACPGQYLWGYNRYKRPAGADAPPQV